MSGVCGSAALEEGLVRQLKLATEEGHEAATEERSELNENTGWTNCEKKDAKVPLKADTARARRGRSSGTLREWIQRVNAVGGAFSGRPTVGLA